MKRPKESVGTRSGNNTAVSSVARSSSARSMEMFAEPAERKHHRGMASASGNPVSLEHTGWCPPASSDTLELVDQQSPTKRGTDEMILRYGCARRKLHAGGDFRKRPNAPRTRKGRSRRAADREAINRGGRCDSASRRTAPSPFARTPKGARAGSGSMTMHREGQASMTAIASISTSMPSQASASTPTIVEAVEGKGVSPVAACMPRRKFPSAAAFRPTT